MVADPKEKNDELKALWSAAVEMFVHQVLYIRRIYPQDSFCHTRFLGVQCRANRQPEVVEYISETVELAISAVMVGDSDEICVVICDQDTTTEHEKYSLNFEPKWTDQALSATTDDLEREMRDLLLSIHSLEGLKTPRWSPETTFQIKLFISSADLASSALKGALSDGKWFSPNNNPPRHSERRRPAHEMVKSGCRFYFNTILT